MPARTLPPRPNLEQLKRQAQELRRDFKNGDVSAAARLRANLPQFKHTPDEAVFERKLNLADAQRTIANEYGFADWARLKHHVEFAKRVARFTPHPRFEAAVAAMDAGDLEALKRLLAENPELIKARGYLDPPYGYFSAATLLHHVAGNPRRERYPKNIVAVAKLLLEAGAEADAETIGRNSGTTMGLVVTSKQASDHGVSGELMELLLKHGAKLDLQSPDCLNGPLANYGYCAAEKMIELGAKADLIAAAALGRMELLRDCFDDAGHLRSKVVRNQNALSSRDAIGLAFLYAYVGRRKEVMDFLLEKDGNWDMTGVNNGTALHRAANEGNLPMVQRLVAKGADVSNRDNPFNATPYSWADHDKRTEVMDWLRANTRIDLHDSVAFNLAEHAAARIQEDPASVNARLDQWNLPNCTPLHLAALMKRDALAKLLLEHGAKVNELAGDGRTALDIAEAAEAPAAVIALLKDRGGQKARDLRKPPRKPKP